RVAKQNPGTSTSNATPATTPPTFQSPLATPSPLNTTSPLAPKPDNSTEDKTADIQPQTRATTQYTIKFTDPEGGSTTPDQHVSKGIQAQRPNDPARPGYAFDGWFTDNVAYDFTQPVTKDTTLTAKWTKDWSISPVKGLTAGGTRVVLTPPPSRGIRFGHASAGNSNSAALGSDGSIYSWGVESGRDTSGLSANQPGIITPPAGIQKFTQVSAGNDYSLAVGSDGNIYSWGDNTTDQLGRDTSKAPANRPGIVIPPTTGIRFTQVSAGAWHALALDENGNIYSWGSNTKGALGRDTSTTPENRPGIVTSPTTGIRFTQVSAGTFFSLAIDSDGNLYSWGSNGDGRLGRTPSSTTPADRPGIVDPPDGVTSFTQASAGKLFSIAIGSDGNLYSWGNNDSGQLGRDTSTTPENKPGKVSIPESDQNIIQASAGQSYCLAIDSHGNLYSWGNNDSGQLGRDASSIPGKKPGKLPPPTERVSFAQASAGVASSLAMGSDGNLYSWGNNDSGQLGRDTTKSSATKAGVVGFPEKPKPTRVSFGDKAGANLTANTDGTWNVTTPAHPEEQVDVAISWTMNGQQPDTHLDYTYINSYTVTFDSAGGQQTPGQQQITIGKQATRPTTDPAKDGFLFDGWFIKDTDGKSDVAYDFSQPVTGDITLVAHWSPASTGGWSISPDKGNAMGGQQATITPPRLSRGIRFNQVSAGTAISGFSVGVASDGNAYAWGDNEDGQLGQDPDKTPTQNTPVRVPLPDGVDSGFTYTQVAAGGAHVVAIGSDQIVYAWGANDQGQLGNGNKDTKNHPKPQPVKGADGQPFKAVQISAGSSDSAAIDPQGRVYTWGSEHYAAYSCGTARPTPTLAKDPNGSGQGLHAVQVSAKYSFIMALDADGNVYTWGYNNYGQLGNGTIAGDYSKKYAADPARVPDPKDASKAFKAVRISAGDCHALAIGQDGTLWAWGYGADAQLGDGGYENRSTPMQVRSPKDSSQGFKVAWISAGVNKTIVGDENGTAWAWGFNNYGQLGINSTNSPQKTPVQMSPPAGQDNPAKGFTPARVSVGGLHTLAIGQDGNAYSWGDNEFGQLGNTSIPTGVYVDAAISLVPVPVMLGQLQITGVKFDKTAVDHLQQNSDGSVTLATPAHSPGRADVIVDWTLGGVIQTQAHLTYTYEGTLPLTGGNGSTVLLLAAGLLAVAGAVAAGRHRRETRIQHA
ncbi:hypothetical protein CI603_01220, partial [Bifidobacterium sp. wkB338]|uniref:RCC1 domain-containing protein n=1 Tax=Bifidobacterium sp. wkB338 TaxID=2025114 RepID=UPI000EF9CAD3